ATATPHPPQAWWSRAGRLAPRSTCGPPATSARRGIGSGGKSPAATSPASTGTPTQAADGRGRRTHTALQTILHSAPSPAPITLPIVPRYGGRGEACLKALWSQPSPSIQGEGWAGRKASAASVHLQSGGLW